MEMVRGQRIRSCSAPDRSLIYSARCGIAGYLRVVSLWLGPALAIQHGPPKRVSATSARPAPSPARTLPAFETPSARASVTIPSRKRRPRRWSLPSRRLIRGFAGS